MTGTTDRRMTARNIVAGVLASVPFFAIVATGLATRERLPSELPVQWSGDVVTNTQPTLALFIGTAAVALAVAVFNIVAGVRLKVSRETFVIPGIFSGLAAAIWMIVAILNATADGGPVQLAWAVLAIPATGFGFIPYLVSDSRHPTPLHTEVDPITLEPTSRAVWSGAVSSWPIGLALVIVAIIGVVLAVRFHDDPVILAISIAVAALGVLAAGFCWIRVTVDRRGLRIMSNIVGIPLRRIPLSRMRQAEAGMITAGAWGGWGYRILPGRSAIVLRSGEGISITLDDGREFAVTVGDSATGVALLRTLLERQF